MKAQEELIKQEAPEEDRKELISSLRELKKKKIIEEIKKDYKEELLVEIHDEVQKERDRQKIDDLKNLMWSGFVLAFIVGLAVNQATDVIGYYKGSVEGEQIWLTMVITGILCMACFAAYLYSFFKKAISIYNNWEKDKREDV